MSDLCCIDGTHQTVICDAIECTAPLKHFYAWPLDQRPLPRCPYDDTETILDTADTWSIQCFYEGCLELFGLGANR